MVNMAASPWCGSPTNHPVAPSKFITQVDEALMPILCSSALAVTALRCAGFSLASSKNFGTKNSEMPFAPAGASGNFANTKCTMFSVRS
jgi:hypothetical protein